MEKFGMMDKFGMGIVFVWIIGGIVEIYRLIKYQREDDDWCDANNPIFDIMFLIISFFIWPLIELDVFCTWLEMRKIKK